MSWFKRTKKTVVVDEARVDELLSRSVDEVINTEHLRKQLLSGKRLRVKLGIDPTSPNMHLGRSVPLLKMRDFQELGHQVVFIVGDFTGVIGDTSDKDSERPMLSPDVIEENKKTYLEQVGKIIDIRTAEFHYNSKWLTKLGYNDVGRHADMFSVADFIARDNIRKRLDDGKRVSLREVLYPLMQGYDSVAVKADVEIGGVDQRFNLLAGRTLQGMYEQEQQDIIMTTFPIEGTDGRKMSSSWGNTINFNDEANDMFGKVMRVRDTLIERYFTLLTRVPTDEVVQIIGGHPKEAKERLAFEIVSLYHGSEAAQKARDVFQTTFSEGGVPEDVPIIRGVSRGNKLSSVLLKHSAVGNLPRFDSTTKLKRLFEEGAIKDTSTNTVIKDFDFTLEETTTFKIGKRDFVKIIIK